MNYFSIIIPVYNEEGNIPQLINEIYDSLSKYKNSFEIIIMNDASVDDTLKILYSLKKKYSLNIYNNKINKGQSYCIYNSISKSKYDTIVTIDGDGQNNPKDIIKLLDEYNSDHNVKLVSGIRINRKDNWIKRISSKMANKIRMSILNDNCIDTGCSLKIFSKEIFLSFAYFNGIHRFIPALFNAKKVKIKYVNVDHRFRDYGKSNYGTIDRLFRGVRDIIKVKNLIRKIND